MKIETKVYDNAVPEGLVKQIKELIVSEKMDWFLKENPLKGTDKEDSSVPCFYHNVYKDGVVFSNLFQDVASILMYSGLPIGEIIEINVQLMFNFGAKKNQDNVWKKHIHDDCYSLIYNVCESSSETIIHEDDGADYTRVESKEGGFVVFETHKPVCNTPPFNSGQEKRMVINFIVKKPVENTETEIKNK